MPDVLKLGDKFVCLTMGSELELRDEKTSSALCEDAVNEIRFQSLSVTIGYLINKIRSGSGPDDGIFQNRLRTLEILNSNGLVLHTNASEIPISFSEQILDIVKYQMVKALSMNSLTISNYFDNRLNGIYYEFDAINVEDNAGNILDHLEFRNLFNQITGRSGSDCRIQHYYKTDGSYSTIACRFESEDKAVMFKMASSELVKGSRLVDVDRFVERVKEISGILKVKF